MYKWRKLNETERDETLLNRQSRKLPWHDVPCRDSGKTSYLISAACYEHRPIIGVARKRMNQFSEDLIEVTEQAPSIAKVHAWVVLPNHYHLLCDIESIRETKIELGKLHGTTSFLWNREDSKRGRRVWFRAAETVIKSPRHFHASLNYIHQNPEKHCCVESLESWPWSSFSEWRLNLDNEEQAEHWKEYPTDRFGKGWDDESLSLFAAKLLE